MESDRDIAEQKIINECDNYVAMRLQTSQSKKKITNSYDSHAAAKMRLQIYIEIIVTTNAIGRGWT